MSLATDLRQSLDMPLVPDRLGSGRLIDLAHLPASFDWLSELAEPSAKIARFAGQIPGNPYSVAEHECRGSDAIYQEQAQLGMAGHGPNHAHAFAAARAIAFLFHDKHEPLGGDVKRPFVDLCEILAARDGLMPAGLFRRIIENAKDHIDRAIHAAAGLTWPLPADVRLVVHDMDERMAAEEMRRFWPGCPLPPHYETRKRVPVEDWAGYSVDDRPPWSWQRAAGEWMARFNRWRPVHAMAGGAGQ